MLGQKHHKMKKNEEGFLDPMVHFMTPIHHQDTDTIVIPLTMDGASPRKFLEVSSVHFCTGPW